jgi:hypothetical protein
VASDQWLLAPELAPKGDPIIKDRQFSALFDAGLTALGTTSDVSATFFLFYPMN